jgi:hypothetical protein
MAQEMPVRSLGRIESGIAQGIDVLTRPTKHGRIDPSKDEYRDPRRLKKDTNPRNRGSKWLVNISENEEFTLIRQVLEENQVTLGGPKHSYRSHRQPQPIGISDGEYVHTVEVQFDGRYAHGYPREP